MYNAPYFNQTQFDPTSDIYFKHQQRTGGPVMLDQGFIEVFREVFQKNYSPPKSEDGESKNEESNERSESNAYKEYPLYKVV